MKKLRTIFNMDIIAFLLINILFVDSLVDIFLFGLFVVYPTLMAECISDTLSELIFASCFMIIVFVKMSILIFYYKFCYAKFHNLLLIRLFENLKNDTNHFRIKFLTVVTLPYIILTIIDGLILYVDLKKLIDTVVFSLFFSCFFPYMFLFIYWDYLQFKMSTNNNLKTMFKLIKKYYRFLILMFIVVCISYFCTRNVHC